MSEFTAESWQSTLREYWHFLPEGVQDDLTKRPAPREWIAPKSNIIFLQLIKYLKQSKFNEIFSAVSKADIASDHVGYLAIFGAYAAIHQENYDLAKNFLANTSGVDPALVEKMREAMNGRGSERSALSIIADKGSCLLQEKSVVKYKQLGRSKMKAASMKYTGSTVDQSCISSIEECIEIKIINLKHRTDRWMEIKSHLDELGFQTIEKYRFEAVGVEGFGELGCTRSHLMALTEYLCKSEKPYLMILEDDFRFKADAIELTEMLHWFMSQSQGDVLMMNCSCAMLVPDGCREGKYTVNRVISSNSMAGFVIKRSHVRELIAVLLDSLRSHESVGHIYQNLKSQGRRESFRPILNMVCNDRVWVSLQTSHRYLTLIPSIGSTVESYSDIESRHVDYRHMEVQ